MLKLVIAATVLALVQCQSGEFSCLDGPPGGFFCSNDLTGYYDCNLDSNNQTRNIRKNCTLGTKCSCFINIKCEDPEAQICKPLPTPPTLSENFDYVYAQKIINQSPTAVTISKKKERTIRNAGLKLVWGRSWDLDTGGQSFQVITPNGNNSFSYTGTYPPGNSVGSFRCQRLSINGFPSFWPDLGLYQRTRRLGNIQTWEFKVGARTPNQTAFGEIYDFQIAGGTVTPLKHFLYRNASNVNRSSYNETRTLHGYFPLIRDKDFFQVPAFCPNIVPLG